MEQCDKDCVAFSSAVQGTTDPNMDTAGIYPQCLHFLCAQQKTFKQKKTCTLLVRPYSGTVEVYRRGVGGHLNGVMQAGEKRGRTAAAVSRCSSKMAYKEADKHGRILCSAPRVYRRSKTENPYIEVIAQALQLNTECAYRVLSKFSSDVDSVCVPFMATRHHPHLPFGTLSAIVMPHGFRRYFVFCLSYPANVCQDELKHQ